MNYKFKDNKIPKNILDAFSSQKIEYKIRCHSSTFISPKNIIITPPNEEQENEKELETKEYKIGNYIVKHTLGQGTFGKVKLGLYLPYEEKVAIKILEKNRIVEKDDEIRVKREFDMLAKFNHPNVILVAEIFESEDSFYSVMEYCEGGELFNYIVKKTRLSEEESSFFFYQLINGLEYIHSLGIVHRDLKPENLLLTNEHLLKIIDFGLSNYFKENQDPLLSTPCGSPCYASPEMVAGKKYDGFKIDVWSCGIILYAMLCGYLPFEDLDNEVLFKKILECDLEFPSYVKKLSIDLIKKILVTDPEKRITISQIKKHPFYLKGKQIFEQEFSTVQISNSPKDTVPEANKENIDLNHNNNDKQINKKPELIEINLEEKQKINLDINTKKEEIEKKTISEKDKNPEKITEKEKKKDEKIKKEKKINKEKITKDENISDITKAKSKKENNLKNKNTNMILNEQEEIYIPLKTEYTDSNNNYSINKNEITKEENDNNKEEKELNLNKIKKYNTSNIKTIETESKIPFRKLVPKSRIRPKEKRKEKPKEKIEKLKENSKEINRSKEKEMSKEKYKENINENRMKIKEKLKLKTIDKEKGEKLNEINKNENTMPIQNPKVLVNNQENKKTITPKKRIHNFKTLKTQRPINFANTKNINLNFKGKTLKYLDNKNAKIVSAKEPLKIRSTFKNLNSNKVLEENLKDLLTGIENKVSIEKKDKNLNNNRYINNNDNKITLDIKDTKTFKELKSNSKNKQKENLEDNKWQRLNTEYLQNKNKNYLENRKTVSYINNTTLDAIKNSGGLGYISDIKKNTLVNKNNKKKYEIKLHINLNDRKDKRKNNDIKRIKSTNFNENNITMPINTTYNSSTIKAYLKNPLKNRLQIITNNGINGLSFGTNNNNYNYSNKKLIYETEINDNIVKTEPSSEYFTKLNNKNSNYSHIKTNTNTIQSSKLSKGYYTKKLHYIPTINFRDLSTFKKIPNYNLVKPNDITKKISNNDIIRKSNINKYKRLIIPKNPQFTIRNTVINVNMYDTGLFIPNYNKNILDRKKKNIIGTYNTLSQVHPNKKYSQDPSEIYARQTYNIPINKTTNLNNSTFKPLFKNKTLTSNHCNNHSLSINQNNSLNNKDLLHTVNQRLKLQNKIQQTKTSVISLNKLINRMKNKQNKRHSNSVEKNHSIFNSIKLSDIFKSKNDKKNLELNNVLTNSINNPNMNNNKLQSINANKNYTLPSLIVHSKNLYYPKTSLMQPHGKTLRFINPLQTNNINEGFKPFFLKGINTKL